MKSRVFKKNGMRTRLITLIVITSLLCSNIAWGCPKLQKQTLAPESMMKEGEGTAGEEIFEEYYGGMSKGIEYYEIEKFVPNEKLISVPEKKVEGAIKSIIDKLEVKKKDKNFEPSDIKEIESYIIDLRKLAGSGRIFSFKTVVLSEKKFLLGFAGKRKFSGGDPKGEFFIALCDEFFRDGADLNKLLDEALFHEMYHIKIIKSTEQHLIHPHARTFQEKFFVDEDHYPPGEKTAKERSMLGLYARELIKKICEEIELGPVSSAYEEEEKAPAIEEGDYTECTYPDLLKKITDEKLELISQEETRQAEIAISKLRDAYANKKEDLQGLVTRGIGQSVAGQVEMVCKFLENLISGKSYGNLQKFRAIVKDIKTYAWAFQDYRGIGLAGEFFQEGHPLNKFLPQVLFHLGYHKVIGGEWGPGLSYHGFAQNIERVLFNEPPYYIGGISRLGREITDFISKEFELKVEKIKFEQIVLEDMDKIKEKFEFVKCGFFQLAFTAKEDIDRVKWDGFFNYMRQRGTGLNFNFSDIMNCLINLKNKEYLGSLEQFPKIIIKVDPSIDNQTPADAQSNKAVVSVKNNTMTFTFADKKMISRLTHSNIISLLTYAILGKDLFGANFESIFCALDPYENPNPFMALFIVVLSDAITKLFEEEYENTKIGILDNIKVEQHGMPLAEKPEEEREIRQVLETILVKPKKWSWYLFYDTILAHFIENGFKVVVADMDYGAPEDAGNDINISRLNIIIDKDSDKVRVITINTPARKRRAILESIFAKGKMPRLRHLLRDYELRNILGEGYQEEEKQFDEKNLSANLLTGWQASYGDSRTAKRWARPDYGVSAVWESKLRIEPAFSAVSMDGKIYNAELDVTLGKKPSEYSISTTLDMPGGFGAGKFVIGKFDINKAGQKTLIQFDFLEKYSEFSLSEEVMSALITLTVNKFKLDVNNLIVKSNQAPAGEIPVLKDGKVRKIKVEKSLREEELLREPEAVIKLVPKEQSIIEILNKIKVEKGIKTRRNFKFRFVRSNGFGIEIWNELVKEEYMENLFSAIIGAIEAILNCQEQDIADPAQKDFLARYKKIIREEIDTILFLPAANIPDEFSSQIRDVKYGEKKKKALIIKVNINKAIKHNLPLIPFSNFVYIFDKLLSGNLGEVQNISLADIKSTISSVYEDTPEEKGILGKILTRDPEYKHEYITIQLGQDVHVEIIDGKEIGNVMIGKDSVSFYFLEKSVPGLRENLLNLLKQRYGKPQAEQDLVKITEGRLQIPEEPKKYAGPGIGQVKQRPVTIKSLRIEKNISDKLPREWKIDKIIFPGGFAEYKSGREIGRATKIFKTTLTGARESPDFNFEVQNELEQTENEIENLSFETMRAIDMILNTNNKDFISNLMNKFDIRLMLGATGNNVEIEFKDKKKNRELINDVLIFKLPNIGWIKKFDKNTIASLFLFFFYCKIQQSWDKLAIPVNLILGKGDLENDLKIDYIRKAYIWMMGMAPLLETPAKKLIQIRLTDSFVVTVDELGRISAKQEDIVIPMFLLEKVLPGLRRYILNLPEVRDLISSHSGADRNIACGPTTEELHSEFNEQLERQYARLRNIYNENELAGKRVLKFMTEDEVDPALLKGGYITENEFRSIKMLRDEMRKNHTFILAEAKMNRKYRTKDERIGIFFMPPETKTKLFWCMKSGKKAQYLAGHFNKDGRRIHISLPVALEDVRKLEENSESEDLLSSDIIEHESEHILYGRHEPSIDNKIAEIAKEDARRVFKIILSEIKEARKEFIKNGFDFNKNRSYFKGIGKCESVLINAFEKLYRVFFKMNSLKCFKNDEEYKSVLLFVASVKKELKIIAEVTLNEELRLLGLSEDEPAVEPRKDKPDSKSEEETPAQHPLYTIANAFIEKLDIEDKDTIKEAVFDLIAKYLELETPVKDAIDDLGLFYSWEERESVLKLKMQLLEEKRELYLKQIKIYYDVIAAKKLPEDKCRKIFAVFKRIIEEYSKTKGAIIQGTKAWEEFNATREAGVYRRLNDTNPEIWKEVKRVAEENDISLNGVKIYGMVSIVKGRKDFVHGYFDRKTNELFLAVNIIEKALAYDIKRRTRLLDEYAEHELKCEGTNHQELRQAQKKKYTAYGNYSRAAIDEGRLRDIIRRDTDIKAIRSRLLPSGSFRKKYPRIDEFVKNTLAFGIFGYTLYKYLPLLYNTLNECLSKKPESDFYTYLNGALVWIKGYFSPYLNVGWYVAVPTNILLFYPFAYLSIYTTAGFSHFVWLILTIITINAAFILLIRKIAGVFSVKHVYRNILLLTPLIFMGLSAVDNFVLGQINMLYIIPIILALVIYPSYDEKPKWWKLSVIGLLLALSIWIKFFPIILLVYFVMPLLHKGIRYLRGKRQEGERFFDTNESKIFVWTIIHMAWIGIGLILYFGIEIFHNCLNAIKVLKVESARYYAQSFYELVKFWMVDELKVYFLYVVNILHKSMIYLPPILIIRYIYSYLSNSKIRDKSIYLHAAFLLSLLPFITTYWQNYYSQLLYISYIICYFTIKTIKNTGVRRWYYLFWIAGFFIALSPSFSHLIFTSQAFHRRMKDISETISCFISNFILLGLSYRMLFRNPKDKKGGENMGGGLSREDLEKFAETTMKNNNIKDLIGYFELTEMYYQIEDIERALSKEPEKLKEFRKGLIEMLLSAGDGYLSQGDIDKACALYQDAYIKFKDIIKKEGREKARRAYNPELTRKFIELRRKGYLKEPRWFNFKVSEIIEMFKDRYADSIETTEFGRLAKDEKIDENNLNSLVIFAAWLYKYADWEMAQILLEHVLRADKSFDYYNRALHILALLYSAKKEYFWLTDSYEYCYPYSVNLLEQLLQADPGNKKAKQLLDGIRNWDRDLSYLKNLGPRRSLIACAEPSKNEPGYRMRRYGFSGDWYIRNLSENNFSNDILYRLGEKIIEEFSNSFSGQKENIKTHRIEVFIKDNPRGNPIQFDLSQDKKIIVTVDSAWLEKNIRPVLRREEDLYERVRTSINRIHNIFFPETKKPAAKVKILIAGDINPRKMGAMGRNYIYHRLCEEYGKENVLWQTEEYLQNVSVDLSEYTHLLISYPFESDELPSQTLLQFLKKRFPHLYIVVGGVNTVDIEKAIERFPETDCIIRYQGCDTLKRLMDITGITPADGELNEKQIEELSGLKDSFYLRTGNLTIMKNLDKLNIDEKLYFPDEDTIYLDLGCPYDCAFCNTPKIRHKVIIDDMIAYLKKRLAARKGQPGDSYLSSILGIRRNPIEIRIMCDHLLINKTFCKDLFNRIIKEGLNEYFRLFISDSSVFSVFKNGELDSEYLDLLKNANASVMVWGIDGRSNAVIKQNGKPDSSFSKFMKIANKFPEAKYSNIMSTPDSNVFDVLEQIILSELVKVKSGNNNKNILIANGSMFTNENCIFYSRKQSDIYPKNPFAAITLEEGYKPYDLSGIKAENRLYAPYWEQIIRRWNSNEEEDPEIRALGKLAEIKIADKKEKGGEIDYIDIFMEIKKELKEAGIISFIELLDNYRKKEVSSAEKGGAQADPDTRRITYDESTAVLSSV